MTPPKSVEKPVRKPERESRYVPEFDSSRTAAAHGDVQALPPIRTGVEAIHPQICKPHVVYAKAPLTCVRWLPASGADAVAVVGTGDGACEEDMLYFHSVHMDRGAVVSRPPRELEHPGKVNDIATSRVSGTAFFASSDGGVRCLPTEHWSHPDASLEPVAELPAYGLRPEAAVGVAPLAGGSVMAFGASGTLIVADPNLGEDVAHIANADAVGFRSAAPVDPDGGFLAAAAGSSGEVTVWDSRGRTRDSACAHALRHPVRGTLPLCVAVDATQPNFVIAGTASGELCIWDRRGVDKFPLSRVAVHDGFVWDVQVVASRPGLLLSCGEDASVWLMDYGNAAKRAPTGTLGDSWLEAGEYWRAQLTQSDLRDVSPLNMLGINSVCAHPQADLYAYTSDSASVTFGSLYN